MSIVRVLARPMLASSFILSGINALMHTKDTAEKLSPVLSPVVSALPLNISEKNLAMAVAGTQVGAGLLLATGKFARAAAVVLSVTAALTTAAEYRASSPESKEGKSHRRAQLAKNIGLLGGALLASVDTAGRPGLVWRAEKLIDQGKKSTAKQLKKADHSVRALAHDVTGQ